MAKNTTITSSANVSTNYTNSGNYTINSGVTLTIVTNAIFTNTCDTTNNSVCSLNNSGSIIIYGTLNNEQFIINHGDVNINGLLSNNYNYNNICNTNCFNYGKVFNYDTIKGGNVKDCDNVYNYNNGTSSYKSIQCTNCTCDS